MIVQWGKNSVSHSKQDINLNYVVEEYLVLKRLESTGYEKTCAMYVSIDCQLLDIV